MSKTGVVKFFNEVKGFGFIEQDDGGEDLFAHKNDLADGQNLMEGDAVRYNEDYDDRKGKTHATNITGGTGGVGGGGKGGGKGFGKKGGFSDKGYGGGKGGGKSFDRFDDGGGKGKGKGKGKPNTVFIAGLSWDTTTDALTSYFQNAGEIIYANVMTDRNTGRSKGCGKIEFGSADAADYAIATLNQTELDGRTITVRAFT